mmetsp:Transcript_52250/g.127635  ORF Transcript_52250/g.127635 Transcript_52250/m.127635 type:complete len:236 (+) Transcript_52250:1351-2058(+)
MRKASPAVKAYLSRSMTASGRASLRLTILARARALSRARSIFWCRRSMRWCSACSRPSLVLSTVARKRARRSPGPRVEWIESVDWAELGVGRERGSESAVAAEEGVRGLRALIGEEFCALLARRFVWNHVKLWGCEAPDSGVTWEMKEVPSKSEMERSRSHRSSELRPVKAEASILPGSCRPPPQLRPPDSWARGGGSARRGLRSHARGDQPASLRAAERAPGARLWPTGRSAAN